MVDPPDPLQRSICDYSLWMHNRMDLLESHQSNAEAPPRTAPQVEPATMNAADLKTHMQGLRLLSRLTAGERIPRSAEEIIDKQPKPSNVLHSIWQYLVSASQAENPVRDLIATKKTVIGAQHCLNNLSIREFIAGYHEQINLLHKLKKYTSKSIEQGLPTYLKTASHFFKISNTVPDDRTRVANEIDVDLKMLRNYVTKLIDRFEEHNKEGDLEHARRFLALLFDPSPQNFEYYFQKGIPTLILNSAAKEQFISLFGQSLVERVYRFYKLEHKGMIRLHDLHALAIGMAAHLTLDEKLPANKNIEELLGKFRKIPLDGINARACYQEQLARDIAFLKASWTQDACRKNKLHKYCHVKHYLQQIAPLFLKHPSSQSSEGMLFCDQDLHYKQLFAIHVGAELFALVIKSEQRSSVRIILTTLESQSGIDEIVQKLQPLLLEQEQQAPIIIEICVPYDPKATMGTALSRLLTALHSIVPIEIGALQIHLGGPQEVSLNTNAALLELAKKRPAISFQVRYFIYNNEPFKNTTQAYLGSVKQNERLPSNLEVAVFYVLSNDNFSSIFTHNLEDCELLVDKEPKAPAGITHPQKINELFFPPDIPSQPGYIASYLSSITSRWHYRA